MKRTWCFEACMQSTNTCRCSHYWCVNDCKHWILQKQSWTWVVNPVPTQGCNLRFLTGWTFLSY